MKTFEVLIADFLWFALVLIATFQLPKIWRDHAPILRVTPGWWVWGEALWSGVRRIIPLSVVMGWVVLGVLVFPTLGRDPAQLAGPEFAIAIALGIGVLGVGVLMSTVVLFNRPSSLVPPAWRSEPGAVRSWFNDGVTRRGRSRTDS